MGLWRRNSEVCVCMGGRGSCAGTEFESSRFLAMSHLSHG